MTGKATTADSEVESQQRGRPINYRIALSTIGVSLYTLPLLAFVMGFGLSLGDQTLPYHADPTFMKAWGFDAAATATFGLLISGFILGMLLLLRLRTTTMLALIHSLVGLVVCALFVFVYSRNTTGGAEEWLDGHITFVLVAAAAALTCNVLLVRELCLAREE